MEAIFNKGKTMKKSLLFMAAAFVTAVATAAPSLSECSTSVGELTGQARKDALKLCLSPKKGIPTEQEHAEYVFVKPEDLKLPSGMSAVKHYFGSTFSALFMCSLARGMDSSLTSLQTMGKEVTPEQIEQADYRACIRQYRVALKKVNAKAVNSAKNTATKQALKEHYVLAITALEGIAPMPSERVIDYERRTNAEKRALDQQEVRVEASQ